MLKSRNPKWKIRCAACDKVFATQKLFDAHLDNHHQELLPTSNAVCLADLREVLHVNDLLGQVEQQGPCASSQMKALRGSCEKLVSSCLPLEQQHGQAREHLLSRLCAAHTCDQREKSRLLGQVLIRQDTMRRVMWVASWVLCASGLVLFYLLLYCWWYHHGGYRSAGGDVRRRHQPPRPAAWSQGLSRAIWQAGKEKVY